MKDSKINEFFMKIGFTPKKIIQLIIIGFGLMIIFGKFFGIKSVIFSIPFILSIVYLKSTDFTKQPFKRLIIISILFILITIIPYIAFKYTYYGIVINFISIFCIAYTLTSKYKASLYFPVVYYFVYAETFKVTFSELKLRIVASIVGSVYIVFVLYMLSKRNISNDILNDSIENSIKLNISEIQHILNGNYDEEIYKSNKKLLKKISKEIYLGKVKGNIDFNGENISLNLLAINNGINITLKEVYSARCDYDDKVKEFLEDLILILDNIIKFSNNEIDKNKYNLIIEHFILKYDEKSNEYYIIFQILQLIKIKDIEIMNEVKISRVKSNNKIKGISKFKEFIKTWISGVNLNSINFRFAIRLSTILTIALFINNYFNSSKLYWIPISVMTVTQPFFEDTFSKALLRFKGTIIGSGIVLIIFAFPLDNKIKIIIFIVSIIISVGFTKYDKSVAFNTVASIVLASITMGEYSTLLERILYVSIGVAMAIFANRFILPYKINDAVYDYINNIIEEEIKIIEDVKENMSGVDNWNKIKISLDKYYNIANKISLYNTKLQIEAIDKFILYSNIYIKSIAYNLLYYNNYNIVKNNSEVYHSIYNYFIDFLNNLRDENNIELPSNKTIGKIRSIFDNTNLKDDKMVLQNIINAIAVTNYIKENYKIIER